MKIKLSELARRDLRDILTDLASDNVAAARSLDVRFTDRLQQLSRFPELGRPRPDIAPRTRSLLVSPYVIFYATESSAIFIQRVLHGSRDLREMVLP